MPGQFIPAPANQITRLVDEVIERAKEACKTDEYLCVLSGEGNFRNEVAKQAPYKGNRKEAKPRPYHYDTVGAHILKNHPVVVVDGHEADDYLGYTQYQGWKEQFRKQAAGFGLNPEELATIIASRDKDLRTIQGWHYSWSCGENQPEKPLYYISPSQGMYQFFYQMLIGDNTDNILGCGIKKLVPWGKELNEEGEEVPRMMLRRKGVGDKGAHKLLSACKSVSDMKEVVALEYTEMFGTEAYRDIMMENARLLFIGQTQENLFEWKWLDKYLNLENELYVDPETVPKKTRKRKKKDVVDPTIPKQSGDGVIHSEEQSCSGGTLIPTGMSAEVNLPVSRSGNDNDLPF